MEILQYTAQLRLCDTAIAVGKFDGVHLGHQMILQELQKQKQKGLKSVAVTFDHAPGTVLRQEEEHCLLTGTERDLYYEQMGLDYVVVLPAVRQILQMPAPDFLETVLCGQLGMRCIVAGSDFRFGKDRMGDSRFLREMAPGYGYNAVILPKLKQNDREISSTYVKELLSAGRMEEISRLLGRPYTIVGKVVYGNRLGRTVGMPTINLLPEPGKLLPPNGVYAARVYLKGNRYNGITNVGYKPTVAKKPVMGVETHIFDFEEEVYGEIATVELLQFIRSERRFENLEAVKAQVDDDITAVKKHLHI